MSPKELSGRNWRKSITYDEARDDDNHNMLVELKYPSQEAEFFAFIHSRSNFIESRVSHHLQVPLSSCHMDHNDDHWMKGSFNLCVPVKIDGFGRVIVRLPFLYRVGGKDNGDEKVRCEAGTYAWMQQNCPMVPIPRLHGFALASGHCFTAVHHLPLYRRLPHHVKCWFLKFLGQPTPTQFVRDDYQTEDDLGAYLIIDFIEEGETLPWIGLDSCPNLRANLFRDLAKVMLAISRANLPKIGSFIIDNDGRLRLANRPLTLMLHDLENQEIVVDIPRTQTFATVDSYVNKLITCHDNHLRLRPNAVKSWSDCGSQMTALALMRSVRPHFFDPQLNDGPFVFCLTDLRPENILVDKDGHILYILDLEWACSLPIEFCAPPVWLTREPIDRINIEGYNQLRQQFMHIYEEEEEAIYAHNSPRMSHIMSTTWKQRTFWFCNALESPTGLHAIFYNHIQPLYSEEHANDPNFFTIVCRYWEPGTPESVAKFVESRLESKAEYDKRLRDMFQGERPKSLDPCTLAPSSRLGSSNIVPFSEHANRSPGLGPAEKYNENHGLPHSNIPPPPPSIPPPSTPPPPPEGSREEQAQKPSTSNRCC